MTITEVLSELPFFSKKPTELSNKQLSDILPLPPKRKKRPKRLTKRQILENVLPLYDSVVIARREHAHKYYAETYNVKITDNKSLDDSLFLAKKSINNLLRDLLIKRRGFKWSINYFRSINYFKKIE